MFIPPVNVQAQAQTTGLSDARSGATAPSLSAAPVQSMANAAAAGASETAAAMPELFRLPPPEGNEAAIMAALVRKSGSMSDTAPEATVKETLSTAQTVADDPSNVENSKGALMDEVRARARALADANSAYAQDVYAQGRAAQAEARDPQVGLIA